MPFYDWHRYSNFVIEDLLVQVLSYEDLLVQVLSYNLTVTIDKKHAPISSYYTIGINDKKIHYSTVIYKNEFITLPALEKGKFQLLALKGFFFLIINN